MTFRDVCKNTAANTYSISPTLDLSPGGRYQIIGELFFSEKPGKINWSIDFEVNIDGAISPINIRHVIELTPMVIVTSNKVEWHGDSRFVFDGTYNSMEESFYFDFSTEAFITNLINGRIVASVSRNDDQIDVNLSFPRLDRQMKMHYNRRMGSDDMKASLSTSWSPENDSSQQPPSKILVDLSVFGGHEFELKSVADILSERYAFTMNARSSMEVESPFFLERTFIVTQKLEIHTTVKLPSRHTMVTNMTAIFSLPRSSEDEMMRELDVIVDYGQSDLHHFNHKSTTKTTRNQGVVAFEIASEVMLKSPKLDEIRAKIECRYNDDSATRGMAKVSISAPAFMLPFDGSVKVAFDKNSLSADVAYKHGEMVVNTWISAKIIIVDTKATISGSFELAIPSLPLQEIKVSCLVNSDVSSMTKFDVRN